MSDPEKKAATKEKVLVILINNQERIEMIGVPGNETAFLGTELTTQRGRGLLPGINLVDPDVLAECRKNKIFDAKFSTKIPKMVAREAQSENTGKPMLVQGREVPAISPLSKLTGPEALELVEQMNDEELVVLLIGLEGKDDVRSALRNRLTLLRTGNEQEDAA